MRHLLAAIVACLFVSPAFAAEPAAKLFEQRILPIFKSPNPSSCIDCHLAGVDLKNYILPSHEKTFLSLRDQGLIDLDRPEKSRILELINMTEGAPAGAKLIQAKTRQAEYEAFAAWIKASAADPKLRNAPKLAAAERAAPAAAPEVIRHGRQDQLLATFEQTIWAQRHRCMGCHREGDPENEKRRKEHGDQVTWMKKTAAETMAYLMSNSEVVNVDEPEKSWLIQKPLGEVKHGGGKKFLPGDLGHKAFRTWIEDYAATVKGKYKKAADLPPADTAVERFSSEHWFKLNETPPEWGDKLAQVTIYAFDPARGDFEPSPIAVSDRGVWGKGKLWQHTLTLVAPKDSARAKAWRTKPQLPPGRFRVVVHVDREGRLAADWKATLGPTDRAGQAEFQVGKWAEGYGAMTVVDARQVK